MTHKSLKNIALLSLAAVVAFGGVAQAQGAAPGTIAADGSVFVGVTGGNEVTHTTPFSAPKPMTFGKAVEYCQGLNAHGHSDWKLPTPAQAKLMIKNSGEGKLKGSFDLTDRYPDGWYVTSSPQQMLHARKSRLSDGDPYAAGPHVGIVRCVR